MNAFLKRSIAGIAFALTVAFSLSVVRSTPERAESKLPIVDAKVHANLTETLSDSVSFAMIAIPGGTYLMGSANSEKNRDPNEGPRHPVTLKAFWIGKCEVAWNEYELFQWKRPGENKPIDPKDVRADAVSRPSLPFIDETFGVGRDRRPAVGMSIHAAMHYCQWLSAKTGKTYRLPTEAEWEWACRAGTTTPYYFGADEAKLGDHAWHNGNADGTTHVVGTKKPNPWGLHDVYGNVAEWCLDYYEPDFYANFPADRATLQPVNLPRTFRYSYVVRGGSWMHESGQCRSATRLFSTKEWNRREPQVPEPLWWMSDGDFVGFRVVCVDVEQFNLRDVTSLISRESEDYEPKKK